MTNKTENISNFTKNISAAQKQNIDTAYT
jgi:hypothetical protein